MGHRASSHSKASVSRRSAQTTGLDDKQRSVSAPDGRLLAAKSERVRAEYVAELPCQSTKRAARGSSAQGRALPARAPNGSGARRSAAGARPAANPRAPTFERVAESRV
jgi:hypothetical protein